MCSLGGSSQLRTAMLLQELLVPEAACSDDTDEPPVPGAGDALSMTSPWHVASRHRPHKLFKPLLANPPAGDRDSSAGDALSKTRLGYVARPLHANPAAGDRDTTSSGVHATNISGLSEQLLAHHATGSMLSAASSEPVSGFLGSQPLFSHTGTEAESNVGRSAASSIAHPGATHGTSRIESSSHLANAVAEAEDDKYEEAMASFLGEIADIEEASSEALPLTEPKPCHLHLQARSGCRRCQQFQKECLEQSRRDKAIGNEGPEPNTQGVEGDHCSIFANGLRKQILTSYYYDKNIKDLDSVEALMEEMSKAQSAAPYVSEFVSGTHWEPSTLFCCIYRLAQLRPTWEVMQQLIHHRSSSLIRAAGFLLVRFSRGPREVWRCLRNYLFDLENSCHLGCEQSMGEWVEGLLTNEKYHGLMLPRLPLSVKKEMAPELVQIGELRQAYRWNMHQLEHFRRRGAKVELLQGASWCPATVVSLKAGGHSILLIVEVADGSLQEVPLGFLRKAASALGDQPQRRSQKPISRERSRSRSPTRAQDLQEEYLQREREKAVVGDGSRKYAELVPNYRRMIATRTKILMNGGDDGPTPMQPASTLAQPDMEAAESGAAQDRRGQVSWERSQQLLQVVRKYSSAGMTSRQDRLEYHDLGQHAWRPNGPELDMAPDTLRLG
eukprot:TRINITY_DN10335_c2_g1_i1.p1 TRINITY_DN10335_c2_g1~~TRINITY_DN10335_c2_g1_i1.p1  ORF type:complete len:669 (+),score=117.08 TRINITY_DN10335_c2_g1_i1:61-2067(+)